MVTAWSYFHYVFRGNLFPKRETFFYEIINFPASFFSQWTIIGKISCLIICRKNRLVPTAATWQPSKKSWGPFINDLHKSWREVRLHRLGWSLQKSTWDRVLHIRLISVKAHLRSIFIDWGDLFSTRVQFLNSRLTFTKTDPRSNSTGWIAFMWIDLRSIFTLVKFYRSPC